jgi:hypothetical protein
VSLVTKSNLGSLTALSAHKNGGHHSIFATNVLPPRSAIEEDEQEQNEESVGEDEKPAEDE